MSELLVNAWLFSENQGYRQQKISNFSNTALFLPILGSLDRTSK